MGVPDGAERDQLRLHAAQKLTSIAYPLGDLLLGGMIVRLAVGRGSRTPAFYLLVGSVFALLLTDSKYAYILVTSTYNGSGSGLDLGWQLFYLLWAAAALHPSMRSLSEPGGENIDRLQRTRLVLLSAATLMVPMVRSIELFRGHAPDEPVLIGAAVVIYLLVAMRMSGLVVRHEQAERRERALREVGAKFVAAGDADAIRAAAADAISAVSDEPLSVRIEMAPRGRPWSRPLAGLGPVAAADLTEGRTVRLSKVDPQLAETLQLDEVPSALRAVAGAAAARATVGLAVVSSEQPLAKQTVQAVEGLMAQASLAMERAQPRRGRAPAAGRSALPLAGAERDRPHHGHRPRRNDPLPEPVGLAGCSATSRPPWRAPTSST